MGTNKQNTQGHKKEEQRSFLILGLFLRKKLAKKDMMCDTSVPMTLQIELSNKQEQTQLFFLSNGKKALSGSTLYANSFTNFFSNFFNLILISQKSVKLQSVFQNFFFPIIATHWLKYEKKKYYGPCENTHLYT